ncbi:hypothetical protein ACFWPX_30125 [Nocardia sp. NPDC058518]|uniref:hypothetical protein n=1 Tax=Nocardia sp. NPDC058518 TaxID=3346534 RepID=UPI003651C1DF
MAATNHTDNADTFYAVGTTGRMYSKGDMRIPDTLVFDVTRFGDTWDLSVARMAIENGINVGTVIAYESDHPTESHAMAAAEKYELAHATTAR